MCFTLTSLTWTSEGLREKDCQGTECTQKEQDFRCNCFTAPSFRVYILHVYIQHMCMYVHVCIIYCLMAAIVTTYTRTQTICLGSQWVSIWVRLKVCHVTYSLLGAALVLASGWTRPRQALDLTWAMFSGTSPWLILTELFGSQLWPTRVLSPYFNVQGNERGGYISL